MGSGFDPGPIADLPLLVRGLRIVLCSAARSAMAYGLVDTLDGSLSALLRARSGGGGGT